MAGFAIVGIAQSSQVAAGMQAIPTHRPGPEHDGKRGTITGYVRDVACLLRNPDAGPANTPETRECMIQCVRAGSPLGILSSDGTLYTAISQVVPDPSTRKQLLPYVGKYVRVTGQLFERGNMHAIAISKIEVVQPTKS